MESLIKLAAKGVAWGLDMASSVVAKMEEFGTEVGNARDRSLHDRDHNGGNRNGWQGCRFCIQDRKNATQQN